MTETIVKPQGRTRAAHAHVTKTTKVDGAGPAKAERPAPKLLQSKAGSKRSEKRDKNASARPDVTVAQPAQPMPVATVVRPEPPMPTIVDAPLSAGDAPPGNTSAERRLLRRLQERTGRELTLEDARASIGVMFDDPAGFRARLEGIARESRVTQHNRLERIRTLVYDSVNERAASLSRSAGAREMRAGVDMVARAADTMGGAVAVVEPDSRRIVPALPVREAVKKLAELLPQYRVTIDGTPVFYTRFLDERRRAMRYMHSILGKLDADQAYRYEGTTFATENDTEAMTKLYEARFAHLPLMSARRAIRDRLKAASYGARALARGGVEEYKKMLRLNAPGPIEPLEKALELAAALLLATSERAATFLAMSQEMVREVDDAMVALGITRESRWSGGIGVRTPITLHSEIWRAPHEADAYVTTETETLAYAPSAILIQPKDCAPPLSHEDTTWYGTTLETRELVVLFPARPTVCDTEWSDPLDERVYTSTIERHVAADATPTVEEGTDGGEDPTVVGVEVSDKLEGAARAVVSSLFTDSNPAKATERVRSAVAALSRQNPDRKASEILGAVEKATDAVADVKMRLETSPRMFEQRILAGYQKLIEARGIRHTDALDERLCDPAYDPRRGHLMLQLRAGTLFCATVWFVTKFLRSGSPSAAVFSPLCAGLAVRQLIHAWRAARNVRMLRDIESALARP